MPEKAASNQKLLFFGDHILKSAEARAKLQPIRDMLTESYRDDGIDGDLILSLEKFPNVIVYESMNLDSEMEKKLNHWFGKHNYKTLVCNGNTMATKINLQD